MRARRTQSIFELQSTVQLSLTSQLSITGLHSWVALRSVSVQYQSVKWSNHSQTKNEKRVRRGVVCVECRAPDRVQCQCRGTPSVVRTHTTLRNEDPIWISFVTLTGTQHYLRRPSLSLCATARSVSACVRLPLHSFTHARPGVARRSPISAPSTSAEHARQS